MLFQQRNYFFAWSYLRHSWEIWGQEVGKDVLNLRYLHFGKTRTNPATAILITRKPFPSQNLSFLQKETFFTFCCSSCPAVPFLDTPNGIVFLWTLPGPHDNSRQKSGIHHVQLGPTEGMSCHGDTASVSDSATLVMGSLLIFPVFPIFLLSSHMAEIHPHCDSAAPSSRLGHLTGSAVALQACSVITATEMWLIWRVLGIKMYSANKRFKE